MTSKEIQRLLHQTGLRPQQAAGQNFLLDEQVTIAMVDAAGITADDTVLEIGPGFGILTEALLATGARVIAVELDQRLFAYLRKRFRGQQQLQLVQGDIFRVRLDDYVRDGEYAVVANLPYSATSLVFRNFLTLPPRPSSMTVMVQRDVARRIVARPGEMSMLSLTVQYYARPTALFDVPPASFYPAPKVTSSVIHCDQFKPVRPDDDRRLFRIMRAGFSSKRKKLSNSLASSLKISQKTIENDLLQLKLSPLVRAQELKLEDWLKLAQFLG